MGKACINTQMETFMWANGGEEKDTDMVNLSKKMAHSELSFYPAPILPFNLSSFTVVKRGWIIDFHILTDAAKFSCFKSEHLKNLLEFPSRVLLSQDIIIDIEKKNNLKI